MGHLLAKLIARDHVTDLLAQRVEPLLDSIDSSFDAIQSGPDKGCKASRHKPDERCDDDLAGSHNHMVGRFRGDRLWSASHFRHFFRGRDLPHAPCAHPLSHPVEAAVRVIVAAD
jgi:hypothetical protein